MSEGNKIERIEREIGEIKSTLSKLDGLEKVIEDLKRGLMDLRESLNEVENPFNLLKLITSEKDLAKVNEAKPILEKIIVKEKAAGEGQTIEANTQTKSVVEEKPVEETIEKGHTEPISHIKELYAAHVKEPPPRLDFKRIIELIEWIYTMLDLGFDENSIMSLCQYTEFFNIVPRGSAQYISSLSNAIKRARSNNIAEDTFILSIYSLANIMGLMPDQADVNYLIKSFLRGRRLNGACVKAWGSQ